MTYIPTTQRTRRDKRPSILPVLRAMKVGDTVDFSIEDRSEGGIRATLSNLFYQENLMFKASRNRLKRCVTVTRLA